MKTLRNYKITSQIAEGGMGVVYYGQHSTLNRPVAIKQLHSNLTKNSHFKDRFVHEAMILAQLNHPNIVAIYDLIEDNSDFYIVMEYVQGETIDNIMHKINSSFQLQRSIHIFKQILQAFDYAHKKGIIHRDIKPSNIILENDDKPKILDFGIAKLVSSNLHLTKEGTKMGSLFYMSPEQVIGQDVDNRSDIYSLGIVFYEMLTRSLPYDIKTDTEYEVMNNILKCEVPNLNQIRSDIPSCVASAIQKACSKDKGYRFASCKEFLSAIESQNFSYIPSSAVSNQTRIMGSENSNRTVYQSPESYNQSYSSTQQSSKNYLIYIIIALLAIFTGVIIFVTQFNESTITHDVKSTTDKSVRTKPEESQETKADFFKEKGFVEQTVSTWLNCWESRDIECYKSYITYDYVFAPSNAASQDYGTRLSTISRHFRTRTYININHGNYETSINGNYATVSYYQTYNSNEYSDSGNKTVYLRKDNGVWKIYKDTFRP